LVKLDGDEIMGTAATKRCIDCSKSQQIKCFGIEVVNQGINKNKKCRKMEIKKHIDLPSGKSALKRHPFEKITSRTSLNHSLEGAILHE
jgi:hypothetical protein